jgi:hypothetical protein
MSFVGKNASPKKNSQPFPYFGRLVFIFYTSLLPARSEDCYIKMWDLLIAACVVVSSTVVVAASVVVSSTVVVAASVVVSSTVVVPACV